MTEQAEVDRMRRAARSTLRLGPTRALYRREIEPDRLDVERLTGVWGMVQRLFRPIADKLEAISREPMVGCVDFRARKYYFRWGPMREYYGNSMRYVGRGRKWVRSRAQSGAASPVYGPLWLIELLIGATDAAIMDAEDLKGEDATDYRVVCDISKASTDLTNGLVAPSRPTINDPSRVEAVVRLNRDETIERIILQAGFRITFDLSDHGRAPDDCIPLELSDLTL